MATAAGAAKHILSGLELQLDSSHPQGEGGREPGTKDKEQDNNSLVRVVSNFSGLGGCF